jgi:hypothetical protein
LNKQFNHERKKREAFRFLNEGQKKRTVSNTVSSEKHFRSPPAQESAAWEKESVEVFKRGCSEVRIAEISTKYHIPPHYQCPSPALGPALNYEK